MFPRRAHLLRPDKLAHAADEAYKIRTEAAAIRPLKVRGKAVRAEQLREGGADTLARLAFRPAGDKPLACIAT